MALQFTPAPVPIFSQGTLWNFIPGDPLRGLFLLLPLFLYQLFVCAPGYAQNNKRGNNGFDTLRVKKGELLLLPDTLFVAPNDTVLVIPSELKAKVRENPYSKSDRFYDSLREKSYRSKLTKQLYNLLIRSTSTELSDTLNVVKSEAPFLPYEGYEISSISLVKVDVLEGNVLDTTLYAETGIGKAVNALHVKTRDKVLFNSLLFKPGDKVRPFTLGDNERLLRELVFIEDARIQLIPRIDVDSVVDAVVVVKDRFSIIVGGSFGSLDRFSLRLGERNFLGTGKEVTVEFLVEKAEVPSSGYQVRYLDPNIWGSFAQAEIIYSNFWEKEGIEVFSRREFITPQTKWAGGIEFGRTSTFKEDLVMMGDTIIRTPYTWDYQDFWGGWQFLLGGADGRKNIAITARFARKYFSDRPYVELDSNRFFYNSDLVLAGLTFSKRTFLKSSMILAFGITEDVPTGYIIEIIPGVDFGEFQTRPYLGMEFDGAKYFSWGYNGLRVLLGGFFPDNQFEDGTFRVDYTYFSPLKNLRRSQVRQFFDFNYTTGLARDNDQKISYEDFIRGIRGDYLFGQHRLIGSLETVFFSKRFWYGFRLAPFLFADLGWLAPDRPLVRSENFDSALGAGISLRNESLLFVTIELRLAFYPSTPTGGDPIGFNFAVSEPRRFGTFRTAKPELVPYE